MIALWALEKETWAYVKTWWRGAECRNTQKENRAAIGPAQAPRKASHQD